MTTNARSSSASKTGRVRAAIIDRKAISNKKADFNLCDHGAIDRDADRTMAMADKDIESGGDIQMTYTYIYRGHPNDDVRGATTLIMTIA